MKNNIETVIFDFGGVLVEDAAPGRNKYLADFLQVSLEKFERAYGKLRDPFMQREFPEREFWPLLCEDLSVKVPETPYSLWTASFAQEYKKRDSMFTLVSSLRDKGYKVGLLSNIEVPILDYVFDDLKGRFDVMTFSCSEGFVKPQREIYLLALERLSSRPENTVFTDDVSVYVQGARAVGMHGLHFTSEEKFLQDLSELRVKV